MKLRDIALVFNGKTPSKTDQREGGHPVLKIRDIDEYGRRRGNVESFVDHALAAKYVSKWVQRGDTLILNAAHNANYVASKTYFAEAESEGYLATGEWLIVRPKTELVEPAFVNFWLRSSSARKSIRLLVKGIHLYPRDVADLELTLPPLDEQRRIVDILSRAEGILRLRREAEKKAAELVPAIFLEMFGDPATNPKGWPKVPLSDVSSVISGVAKGRRIPAGDRIEVPYMRVANVKDGHLDLAEIKTIEIRPSELGKLRIEPGDLLMTEGGDPDKLGRAALWLGEIPDCVHQNHVFKVRTDRSRLVPTYLRALVGSYYGKDYFARVAKRTTGIASINKTQLSEFPTLVPPLSLQSAFDRHVQAAESILRQQASATEAATASLGALLAASFSRGA